MTAKKLAPLLLRKRRQSLQKKTGKNQFSCVRSSSLIRKVFLFLTCLCTYSFKKQVDKLTR